VAATDNKQRTTAEVKNLFEKNNGSVGAPGSAMFMFKAAADGKLTPVSQVPLQIETKGKLEALIRALEDQDEVVLVARNG